MKSHFISGTPCKFYRKDSKGNWVAIEGQTELDKALSMCEYVPKVDTHPITSVGDTVSLQGSLQPMTEQEKQEVWEALNPSKQNKKR